MSLNYCSKIVSVANVYNTQWHKLLRELYQPGGVHVWETLYLLINQHVSFNTNFIFYFLCVGSSLFLRSKKKITTNHTRRLKRPYFNMKCTHTFHFLWYTNDLLYIVNTKYVLVSCIVCGPTVVLYFKSYDVRMYYSDLPNFYVLKNKHVLKS